MHPNANAFTAASKKRCSGTEATRPSPECQEAFDQWRSTYNLERPQEALSTEKGSTESGEMGVPSGHYQPSGRPFPSELPEISHPAAEHVRTVSARGQIRFAGEQFYVGEAFGGAPVAVRPQEPQQNDAGETPPEGETSKKKMGRPLLP